jgi:hypothetical protein
MVGVVIAPAPKVTTVYPEAGTSRCRDRTVRKISLTINGWDH